MLKVFFSWFAMLFCIYNLNAQLTQGNWLVGGNATFSSVKYSNDVTASYNQTNIQISPGAGYFFIDKLAAGLRPSYGYTKTNISQSNQGRSEFGLGPFVRYYFLNLERRANIFSEVGYRYFATKLTNNPQSTSHGFSLSAGPVVYLNTSVGIEFVIGYSNTKYRGDANDKNHSIQVGLGLQVHLEKEN